MIRGLTSVDGLRSGKPFEPIVRERVLARLSDAAAYRVVVMAAPAGFGKSVAVRHYLDRVGGSSLRCNLRREHATLLGFARALSIALQPVSPNITASLPAMFEHVEASPAAASDIADWIASAIGDYDGTIVIDDLHHARGDERVGTLLADLVERTGDTVRWLFATRDAQELPVATWLAYGLMDLPIDEVDLRLTRGEAVAAARSCEVALRDETLDGLLALTDGWVTAFAFALRASTRTSELARAARGTREMVYAFLAEQVFRGLASADRAFLLRTALLPALDVEMLRAGGLTGVRETIARLRRSTSFVIEDSPGIFRYHDLFREYLEHELRDDDDLFTAVCNDTAKMLESAGDVCEALKLYVEAGRHDAVLATLEGHGAALFDRAQVDVLEAAVASLPPAMLETSALALALAAMIAGLRARYERADALFLAALALATTPQTRAFVALRRAVPLLQRMDAAEALATLAGIDATAIEPLALCARFLGVKAYALSLVDHPTALGVARHALEVVGRIDDPATETTVLQYVAGVEYRSGRFEDAREHAERVVESAEAHGFYGLAGRIGTLLYAIAYDRGDQQSSLWNIARLQRNAERIGDRVMIAYAKISAYQLYVERGDLERIDELQRVLESGESEAAMNAAAGALVPALAMQFAWAGDFAAALAAYDRPDASSARDRVTRELLRCAEQALYAAAAGARDVADAMLRRFSELLAEIGASETTRTHRALRGRLFAALAAVVMCRSATANRLITGVEADSGDATAGLRLLTHAVRAVYVHVETGAGHHDLQSALSDLGTVGYGGYARVIAALPLPVAAANPAFGSLTPMEVRVLTSIAKGATSRELATEMRRSALTIDSHVKSIVRKLHCHGRREAIAIAKKAGIV